MDTQTSSVIVECLSRTTAQDTKAIQRLLAQLSNHLKNQVVPEDFVTEITASPYHDILVARDITTHEIIGCATLTITFGVGAGRRAWLDDFVIDSQHQGNGIGGLLWNEMLAWARQHNATALQFTSSDKHKAAHGFYIRQGAVIRDTNFFKKIIEPNQGDSEEENQL